MTDHLLAQAEHWDRDPDMVQWELDHPDGRISDEEAASMARYAAESCREEGH